MFWQIFWWLMDYLEIVWHRRHVKDKGLCIGIVYVWSLAFTESHVDLGSIFIWLMNNMSWWNLILILSAPSSFLTGNTNVFYNSCLAFAQESGRPSCTRNIFVFLWVSYMMIDTSLDRRNLARMVLVSSILVGSGLAIRKHRTISILATVSAGIWSASWRKDFTQSIVESSCGLRQWNRKLSLCNWASKVETFDWYWTAWPCSDLMQSAWFDSSNLFFLQNKFYCRKIT